MLQQGALTYQVLIWLCRLDSTPSSLNWIFMFGRQLIVNVNICSSSMIHLKIPMFSYIELAEPHVMIKKEMLLYFSYQRYFVLHWVHSEVELSRCIYFSMHIRRILIWRKRNLRLLCTAGGYLCWVLEASRCSSHRKGMSLKHWRCCNTGGFFPVQIRHLSLSPDTTWNVSHIMLSSYRNVTLLRRAIID